MQPILTKTRHLRRWAPTTSALVPAMQWPDRPTAAITDFPYDGWRPFQTGTGKVVLEHLKGRRGHRSDARAQVFLALEAAARCRRMGKMRSGAWTALMDASLWRSREQLALGRGGPADLLWSGHRAVRLSNPSTWSEPWSVMPLDLGNGMIARDALVRR